MKKESVCSGIRDELTALIYGELSLDERETVEDHVAACASCSRALEGLRETKSLLARWDAPRADEDPHLFARRISAQARRGRLRPVLRITAAAAAVLFVVLTVLGSEVRYANGELTLSLRLAGSGRGGTATTTSAALESTVRRIAAEEVHDWTLAQQEERERLVATFDRVRAADQRVLAGLLDSFRTRTARENGLTRRALVDLASYVTRPE